MYELDDSKKDGGADNHKGYAKHSWRYWLVVYLVAAVIVYGLIYYFAAQRGGYAATTGSTNSSLSY